MLRVRIDRISVVVTAFLLAGSAGFAQDHELGFRLDHVDLDVFNELGADSSRVSTDVEIPRMSRSRDFSTQILRGHGMDTLNSLVEPANRDEVNTTRVLVVGGVATISAIAVLDIQRRRWWDERRPRFHIQNDWEYVRWSDKFGHFFSTSLFARGYNASLQWAGLPEQEAQIWATGLAWTNLLYYEILDGFGPRWGFSPGDILFNTAGAAFTYAQWRVPELEPYTLKVSYWPSGWEGKNPTDDYAGQTWWATANLRSALGGKAANTIPAWLNVAVGY
ncbi:MAG: DUF2279 domain-containing protein, partial [Rubricoccaceae bacterium]|nr:DUF2279 domain-containing protein [Rubricoccaceae bacterium]